MPRLSRRSAYACACSSNVARGRYVERRYPYKRLIFGQYLWTVIGSLVLLFLNLFGCFYLAGKALVLKETGRKLAHVERLPQTPDTIVRDLSERLARVSSNPLPDPSKNPPGNALAPLRLASLGTERLRRIDARGAPGRKQCCAQRHQREHDAGENDGRSVQG